MIWLFERGNEAVRVETRKGELGDFVVTVYWHDGQCQIERFSDQAKFRTRLLALEQELAGEDWQHRGNPRLLSVAGGVFPTDVERTSRRVSPPN